MEEPSRQKLLEHRESVFDELNIVCSIVGHKEDLDRVDITHLLKANQDVSYLECSEELRKFLAACKVEELACMIPRYALGSEERDRQIMHRLRQLISNKELLEALEAHEKDDNMPFEQLK
jgi:hypothetical protein